MLWMEGINLQIQSHDSPRYIQAHVVKSKSYTIIQKFGVVKLSYCFRKTSLMVTKTVFDQNYSKNSNIVIYYFRILLSVYTVAH